MDGTCLAFVLWLVVFAPAVASAANPATDRALSTDLAEAMAFLNGYNDRYPAAYYLSSLAEWAFSSNITDYNRQKQAEATLVYNQFTNEAFTNASQFNDTSFPEDVRRQLRVIKNIGVSALDAAKVEEFNEIVSSMAQTYSTASVCRPDKPTQCMQLEPGLAKVMAESQDWDELTWAWEGFRDQVGIPNKPRYERYVELSNEAARANGYPDTGAYWRSSYEVDDLVSEAYRLYDEILPLYKQLHAYIRRIMHRKHGDKVDIKGRIPSNLLGDMWGRFWNNIYKQVVPYPDTPDIDVTDTMRAKGLTPLRMFQLADDFFASCGLKRVNEAFWNNSIIEKPQDGRQLMCHASAWDMGDRQDFRIKMCTEVNMDYFQIIHHELGHIQYDMQYNHQPPSFRRGANRAFHEAVGEVMTLSVSTPTHLSHPDIGLLNDTNPNDDGETDINFLLRTSLQTIGTLPFSLALEQWRWDVFAGEIDVDKWNERWWQLKHDLVGVKAPVQRNETDFEAGAMFHIVIDYSFLRYFIRTIIQFQFHKGLCDAAGFKGPLHRCDIYNSTAAGEKLSNMLKMGSSRPWPEAMEAIAGQRSMSADAIKDYFAPLMAWLEKTNQKNGETIGWDQEDTHHEDADQEDTHHEDADQEDAHQEDSGGTMPGVSSVLLICCLLAAVYTVSASWRST